MVFLNRQHGPEVPLQKKRLYNDSLYIILLHDNEVQGKTVLNVKMITYLLTT